MRSSRTGSLVTVRLPMPGPLTVRVPGESSSPTHTTVIESAAGACR